MNHKRFTLVFILLLVTLIVSACGFRTVRGSGTLITESRNVSNFDHVELSGSGNVIVTQGEAESLTVETDDNIMQYINTGVRDGTLYMGFDEQISSVSFTQLTFTLTVKELVDVTTSGSWDVTVASLDTNRLDVNVDGSGDVTIDALTTEIVGVRIDGSSKVDVAGGTTRQDIIIDGSGEYRAGDLYSETADIIISGSGEATVWVTESLAVDASGSSNISYYGSPSVSSSITGSGQVERLGDK
ncbi:MAG: DUF2807 domain-containing protein [Aquificales bacterium]|nr:DUF2807 domain-containing protein [Aquificales bacterium]